MSVKFKREFITPQMARGLLARNAKNQRNLKERKIPGYARDMINGFWNEDTGQTIKIDPDGYMIDGQNRMAAVEMAGDKLPEGGIWFDMAYGVPTDAMLVIDSGSARTSADGLKIFDVPVRNNVSSVVRWVIMWDLGNFIAASTASVQPTHSEIRTRFVSDSERFVASMMRGKDLARAKIGAARPLAVAHYLFSRIDQEQTHTFFDGLISGASLPEKSPVLALRNRLIRATADRVTAPEQLALCVRAWNHDRAGTEISGNLIISRDGKLTNAMFPQPK